VAINVQEVMDNARFAAAIFSQLDQEHTDRIVRAVYEAAFNARVRLAKMAVEETGIGTWQDKVLKNTLASKLVYEHIKNMKTVGVIRDDEVEGITEIAHQLGPILAVIPVTNPTSTAIFKTLISLKARNPIIISPHRNATRSTSEAARICYEAALEADAPEHCVQWVSVSSRDETHQLMSHKTLALILATGGGGLVHAAYSSGTPAIGVGAGNVPVFVDKSADVAFAAEQIVYSKTFDYGTVCASEQAIVAEEAVAGRLRQELEKQGAYFLSAEEVQRLEPVVYDQAKGLMKADIVGQSALRIAELAQISVPDATRLLVAPLSRVGDEYPLSSEILAPILAWYVARDFDEGVKLCMDLNYHGGIGHTASIFSNDEEGIRRFATLMNAGRVLVNTPSSQGGVGGLFNRLAPSLTLGCGTGGKNITTDNISANHLLNIQRIARRRPSRELAALDTSLLYDESLDAQAIDRLWGRNQ
jgi:acyl-CoA reductase-like NAD-dependent aldehyde dehydrogenase